MEMESYKTNFRKKFIPSSCYIRVTVISVSAPSDSITAVARNGERCLRPNTFQLLRLKFGILLPILYETTCHNSYIHSLPHALLYNGNILGYCTSIVP